MSETHESCIRCRRTLKNPVYREIGYGKICARKAGIPLPGGSARAKVSPAPAPMTGDVVLKRDANGTAITNVPRLVTRHSPTGFEWGYGGSGPADLALNILLAYGMPAESADRTYHDFKREVVAGVHREGGVIAEALIRGWIKGRAQA
jgi:hypothetical protein